MSKQVVLEIPDAPFAALESDQRDLAHEIRLAAAVKWFEIGKLSQAKAAEFAGLSRFDFIQELSRFRVSAVQETVEEIAAGLARE